MDTIILILLAILLIVRICKLIGEIILIIKNPKFKQGCIITFLYFLTFFTFNCFFSSIAEAISSFLNIDYYTVSDTLTISLLILALIGYIYILKSFPETKLLFKLIFLLLSLGLVIFLFYSRLESRENSSKNGEFVNPHDVNGYTRADGTEVSSYFRDGDGDPTTRLSKEDGGGYWRN